MDCLNLPLPQRSPRVLLALAASSAMLVTGCANMIPTATSANPLGVAASISGKVHGGNQPVSGAIVRLRFAGQSGLGKPNPSPYDVAATTVSASDGTGSFSFIKDPNNNVTYPSSGNKFSCPLKVADPFVYVEAIGGNTLNDGTSNSNTAAVFLAPLSESVPPYPAQPSSISAR